MYERMLDKREKPTIKEMTAHCGECAELFTLLNEWLSDIYGTVQEVVFPYGNGYGWGIAHRDALKKRLVCNIFAEENAFTVMMRLSNAQYEAVYEQVCAYTQRYIDERYPCGDGGWIQYRVTNSEHFEDIKKLLSVKC